MQQQQHQQQQQQQHMSFQHYSAQMHGGKGQPAPKSRTQLLPNQLKQQQGQFHQHQQQRQQDEMYGQELAFDPRDLDYAPNMRDDQWNESPQSSQLQGAAPWLYGTK